MLGEQLSYWAELPMRLPIVLPVYPTYVAFHTWKVILQIASFLKQVNGLSAALASASDEVARAFVKMIRMWLSRPVLRRSCKIDRR